MGWNLVTVVGNKSEWVESSKKISNWVWIG